jgi:chemotaxis protein methyltransferase CheR
MDGSRSAGRGESGLDDLDYTRLCDFIYQRTGLVFDASRRHYVEKRLARRMTATRAGTFRSYFNAMRVEARQQELQSLVNELTINETYFFREDHQLRILTDNLLPAIVRRRPGQRIRIWSLPCSTGEEPYSIALHLIESWPDLAHHDVELLASDIDTDVLAAARRGIYRDRSVQNLPSHVLRRHFDSSTPGQHAISHELRGAVTFTRYNILDPLPAGLRASVDVVFCRNLLIYFDQAGQRRAVETIHDALVPGGFVLLGHSESMSRINSIFRPRSYTGGFAYQKPDEAA